MTEKLIVITIKLDYSKVPSKSTVLTYVCQHVPKFTRTGEISNSRYMSTRFGKSSTPVMYNESAIAQHLLDKPLCAKNYSDKIH